MKTTEQIEHDKNLRRVVVSSLVGAVIEWYDFFLYGVVAGLIFNHLYFPEFDDRIGTMLAFATFAVGFVARPLGGLVFGHFGDKIGRKKVALGTAVIMVLCPALLWLAPGFSPVLYGVFLLMGVALGGVDLCVYTMILECCSSQSVGRYSGYYYTVSMAAQVATPILSGIVMDVAPSMLFAYITAMGMIMAASIAAAKHGDAILIDEVARREAAK